jgi:hypothetical protein
MKILKYKVIGVIEDNYLEDDYWNENCYLGFEFDNGDIVVKIVTYNNYGDDCNGSEEEYYQLNSSYDLNSEFCKSRLWTDEEVTDEMREIIQNCIEDRDIDDREESDIEEIIYCD